MQKKRSNVENFLCEECKHNKNHCSALKLQSKKQAKKVFAEREGLWWEAPIKLHDLAIFIKYSVLKQIIIKVYRT